MYKLGKHNLVLLGPLEAVFLDYTSNSLSVYFVILIVCFNFGSFTILALI